ncbi:MAG: ATP-grasp domain-containing protein [Xanthobacteraceae bacterium]
MTDAAEPPLASRRGAIVLGGAHGSLEVARSLGRRGIPVWLLTADNPLASFSRYVVRSVRWRGPNDVGAVDFLLDLARRHGLEGWVLFAGGDDDVRFAAQNHSALSAIFTLTTLPWDQLRSAVDKRLMNARADELGIVHPRTRYPRFVDDLASLGIPFPVILKATARMGRNEFVDAKAWRADDAQTLLARFEEAKRLVGADRIMVQELIPGDGTAQFSYAALWDRGRPIASLVARRRRQFPVEFGFTSTFVETIEQPQVEADAGRFLASLGYSGLVEIEFKYDARDRAYKVLDVNARPWTWIALGAAAGIDFPILQWRLAAGEEIAPHRGQPGARWLYFSRDAAASICAMATGRLSLRGYSGSFTAPLALAVFAKDDPWPALLDLPLSIGRFAARRFAPRKRTDASALPSAELSS